jgi:hypothetical protein
VLAAPPDEQAEYLDRIFIRCTGGGSAAAYGNEELALQLDDSLSPTAHMIEFGEITANEAAAIKLLNDHFLAYWQPDDPIFWGRDALFHDPRWQEVRAMAAHILNKLPDEMRESAFTRSVNGKENPANH